MRKTKPKLHWTLIFVDGTHIHFDQETTHENMLHDVLLISRENRVPLQIISNYENAIYCDMHVIRSFVEKKIDWTALKEKIICDGLFRNEFDIQTPDYEDVESGSLWMLRGDSLTLIDDDNHIQFPYAANKHSFKKV